MSIVLMARDLKVAVWQWPEHRTLWGKHLPKGWKAEVVADEADGAIICSLDRGHYFVLWPEDIAKTTLKDLEKG